MNASNKVQSTANLQQKTIAILQVTRLGDLIQTVQAISTLKKAHPEYRLILIGRSQFTEPLKFLLDQYFDQVYHLDTQIIFQDFATSGIKASLLRLDSFLLSLKDESIDVLINLSFSKSSSYLANLIPSTHKIGSFFDNSNKIQINDKWSQVLYSTVMRGPLNPFSLVDLFKNIIGVKPTENHSSRLSFDANLIVVHPFASTERKTWKPEKWVELIYKTLKDNEKLTISIVGAKNEIIKSQLIVENPLLKQFSHRILNITGKTSIQDMSEIIAQAKLFIGHDSMVGHLASLYNVPTLTISLGNVRPHETTPYQANAYNIAPRTKCFPCFPTDQCAYTQCHHDIPYQLVSNAIKQILSGKELDSDWLKNSNSSFHLSSAIIYKSKFQNGYMTLENLTEGLSDTSDIFRVLYKITWAFVLSDIEINSPFPKLSPTSHRDLLESMNGLQHLFELSEFGKKYSRYILEEISSSTPSIIKIKDYSKKIDEIDHLQEMVQKTSPYLAPVIDYFKVRKGNLFGDNIVKLTESSYQCFEESSQISSILYELIQNTIAEYKISLYKNKSRSELNK